MPKLTETLRADFDKATAELLELYRQLFGGQQIDLVAVRRFRKSLQTLAMVCGHQSLARYVSAMLTGLVFDGMQEGFEPTEEVLRHVFLDQPLCGHHTRECRN